MDILNLVKYIDKLPYKKRRTELLRLVRPAPKRFLYKYKHVDISDNTGKDRAKDLLLRSKLWLSSPNDFNDPFEMSANVIINASGDEKRKYFKSVARNLGLNHIDSQKFVKKMSITNNNVLKEYYKESIRKTFETIGVHCFSYDPRNILMWSHYANEHKGICVQIERVRDFKTLVQVVNVNYSNNYPSINFIKSSVDDIKNTILNKSTDWKYEQECRILLPGQANTKIDINEDSVVGIIFGCIAPDDLKSFIKEIISERKMMRLSPVKLYEAVQHDREFKLYIKKLT